MDLRAKLRLIDQNRGSLRADAPQKNVSDIHEQINGEKIENMHGSCFVAESAYPLINTHGEHPLNLFQSVPPKAYRYSGKDPALENVDLTTALFIDTETTGLAGGAGTVPFLTGIGFIRDGEFIVRQYFMRDYSEEAAVLFEIKNELAAASAIVSYNGKAYDMNLLASRYILNRIKPAGFDLPHLDLLFTARRIWRSRLQDCSLKNIEEKILKFKRVDDVEGYLIPALYFEYLRSGKSRPLIPVFTHNRFDIVSLLVLAGVTGKIFSDPLAAVHYPQDLLSVGRSLESQGVFAEACGCFENIFKLEFEADTQHQAALLLGFIYKRQREWDKAVIVWEKMLSTGGYGIVPYEELAKYYEHRVHKPAAALSMVIEGLKRVEVQRELTGRTLHSEIEDSLTYRKARLERKLAELGKDGAVTPSSDIKRQLHRCRPVFYFP